MYDNLGEEEEESQDGNHQELDFYRFEPLILNNEDTSEEQEIPSNKRPPHDSLFVRQQQKHTNCFFCVAPIDLIGFIRQSMHEKYFDAFNFYFAKPINEIINNERLPHVVHQRDLQVLDESNEYLKRSYSFGEIAPRLGALINFFSNSFRKCPPNLLSIRSNMILAKHHIKQAKVLLKSTDPTNPHTIFAHHGLIRAEVIFHRQHKSDQLENTSHQQEESPTGPARITSFNVLNSRLTITSTSQSQQNSLTANETALNNNNNNNNKDIEYENYRNFIVQMSFNSSVHDIYNPQNSSCAQSSQQSTTNMKIRHAAVSAMPSQNYSEDKLNSLFRNQENPSNHVGNPFVVDSLEEESNGNYPLLNIEQLEIGEVVQDVHHIKGEQSQKNAQNSNAEALSSYEIGAVSMFLKNKNRNSNELSQNEIIPIGFHPRNYVVGRMKAATNKGSLDTQKSERTKLQESQQQLYTTAGRTTSNSDEDAAVSTDLRTRPSTTKSIYQVQQYILSQIKKQHDSAYQIPTHLCSNSSIGLLRTSSSSDQIQSHAKHRKEYDHSKVLKNALTTTAFGPMMTSHSNQRDTLASPLKKSFPPTVAGFDQSNSILTAASTTGQLQQQQQQQQQLLTTQSNEDSNKKRLVNERNIATLNLTSVFESLQLSNRLASLEGKQQQQLQGSGSSGNHNNNNINNNFQSQLAEEFSSQIKNKSSHSRDSNHQKKSQNNNKKKKPSVKPGIPTSSQLATSMNQSPNHLTPRDPPPKKVLPATLEINLPLSQPFTTTAAERTTADFTRKFSKIVTNNHQKQKSPQQHNHPPNTGTTATATTATSGYAETLSHRITSNNSAAPSSQSTGTISSTLGKKKLSYPINIKQSQLQSIEDKKRSSLSPPSQIKRTQEYSKQPQHQQLTLSPTRADIPLTDRDSKPRQQQQQIVQSSRLKTSISPKQHNPQHQQQVQQLDLKRGSQSKVNSPLPSEKLTKNSSKKQPIHNNYYRSQALNNQMAPTTKSGSSLSMFAHHNSTPHLMQGIPNDLHASSIFANQSTLKQQLTAKIVSSAIPNQSLHKIYKNDEYQTQPQPQQQQQLLPQDLSNSAEELSPRMLATIQSYQKPVTKQSTATLEKQQQISKQKQLQSRQKLTNPAQSVNEISSSTFLQNQNPEANHTNNSLLTTNGGGHQSQSMRSVNLSTLKQTPNPHIQQEQMNNSLLKYLVPQQQEQTIKSNQINNYVNSNPSHSTQKNPNSQQNYVQQQLLLQTQKLNAKGIALSDRESGGQHNRIESQKIAGINRENRAVKTEQNYSSHDDSSSYLTQMKSFLQSQQQQQQQHQTFGQNSQMHHYYLSPEQEEPQHKQISQHKHLQASQYSQSPHQQQQQQHNTANQFTDTLQPQPQQPIQIGQQKLQNQTHQKSLAVQLQERIAVGSPQMQRKPIKKTVGEVASPQSQSKSALKPRPRHPQNNPNMNQQNLLIQFDERGQLVQQQLQQQYTTNQSSSQSVSSQFNSGFFSHRPTGVAVTTSISSKALRKKSNEQPHSQNVNAKKGVQSSRGSYQGQYSDLKALSNGSPSRFLVSSHSILAQNGSPIEHAQTQFLSSPVQQQTSLKQQQQQYHQHFNSQNSNNTHNKKPIHPVYLS